MTASAGSEIALFDVEGASVAKRGKAQEPKTKTVARTSTGETAQDIIGAWIGFCQERTGLSVPNVIRGRLSRHVKSLIVDNYGATTIKNGLMIWTSHWMDNPLSSPSMLEQIVWKLAMDQTPEGRRLQEELKVAILRFDQTNGGTATSFMSKQDKREAKNAQGRAGWRELHAQRKRMEENL